MGAGGTGLPSHPALDHTAHRPWPLPDRPWSWRQSWCDLLFAHWPLAPELLAACLPDGLELDTFGAEGWIGVVPFRMEGVMRRPLPDVPGLSAFPELNVRTYVVRDGKPGVWFFSLDATQPLAVWAARRLFDLPYHLADMSCRPLDPSAEPPDSAGPGLEYGCARLRSKARFAARYGPSSPVFRATPGSLEHWLTERYCLYARSREGALSRSEVHHQPWPLQAAWAEIGQDTMVAPLGLPAPQAAPLLHFARRLDVVVWSPERLAPD